MILEILFTIFLVFLNGFFVASEFAIVKVRNSQLEIRIKTGSKLAKIAKSLTEHLDAYLSATQLGITLASLGLGWIGEPIVAKIIKDTIELIGFNIEANLLNKISLPVAFTLITFLHIVFGELAPKSIAIQRPESISLMVSIPLKAFYFLFKPFIWLLNTFANSVIKLLGFEPSTAESQIHSSDEIKYLLEESSKSGVSGIPDKELIENVFEFSEIPVKQIMVPRGKIFGIDINTDIDEIIEAIIDEGYSRIPIYTGNLDNIIGVIFAKDILSIMKHKELIILQDIIRPAYFVNENDKIQTILKNMRTEKKHFAIVLDEFGGTAGIVTLEDIIEEIVGEIQDEYDEELPFVIKSNEGYIVQAYASINDANDLLPKPLPQDEDYETVGGYIVTTLGRIPKEGEEFALGEYFCKILSSDERKIETVLLIK